MHLIPVRTDESTPAASGDRWRVLFWRRYTYQLHYFPETDKIGWYEANHADQASAFMVKGEAVQLLMRAKRENCTPPDSWELEDPWRWVVVERWNC